MLEVSFLFYYFVQSMSFVGANSVRLGHFDEPCIESEGSTCLEFF